jgi:hypothetical protein
MIGVPQRHSLKAISQPTSFVEGKGQGNKASMVANCCGEKTALRGPAWRAPEFLVRLVENSESKIEIFLLPTIARAKLRRG